MQEFFDDVELVKENIVAIRNATTRVGEINQQVSAEFSEVIWNFETSYLKMISQTLNSYNILYSGGGLGHNKRKRAGWKQRADNAYS